VTFDLPEMQYSFDGGKTWRADNPMIGPNMRMRIIDKDGVVIFAAHSEEKEIECSECEGTGKCKRFHYVRDHQK
jgi:hypothetical protein